MNILKAIEDIKTRISNTYKRGANNFRDAAHMGSRTFALEECLDIMKSLSYFDAVFDTLICIKRCPGVKKSGCGVCNKGRYKCSRVQVKFKGRECWLSYLDYPDRALGG